MIDMTTILYCITGALVRVVKGDINNSIIFYGENAYKLNKIITDNKSWFINLNQLLCINFIQFTQSFYRVYNL